MNSYLKVSTNLPLSLSETQYEAESPLQSSLNNTIEHERSSPTKSYMETVSYTQFFIIKN